MSDSSRSSAPPPLPARPSSTAPISTASTSGSGPPLSVEAADPRHSRIEDTGDVASAASAAASTSAGPPALPPRKSIQVSVTPATPEMVSPVDNQAGAAWQYGGDAVQTAPLPAIRSAPVESRMQTVPSHITSDHAGRSGMRGGTEDAGAARGALRTDESGASGASDAITAERGLDSMSSSPPSTGDMLEPPSTASAALHHPSPTSPTSPTSATLPSSSLAPAPLTSHSPDLPPRRPSSPFNPAKAEAAIIRSAAVLAKDTAVAVQRNPLDVGLAVMMGGLVMVAYARVAAWWICLVGVGGLVYLHAQAQGRGEMGVGGVGEDEDGNRRGGRRGDAKAAVQWVWTIRPRTLINRNHALYALFPLVSTDVLAPFIDLLEDALIEKVPPIVTSVRLDAPALGNQPLLLTSMRPMTDEEWFASVSTPSKDAKAPAGVKSPLHPGAGPGHRTSDSADGGTPAHHLGSAFGTGGTGTPVRQGRSASTGSQASAVATPPPSSRRASRASVASFVDEGEVLLETERRRKRDAVLHRLKRRQKQKASDGTGEQHDAELSEVDLTTPISVPIREGAPNGLHSTVCNAEGRAVDDEMDEDNPLMGQYVNYQVGFEYHRRDSTKRKGYGLHVLAYFGVGVKGIGKTELPVYIDMLSIKGTLNIRLLLSANPPFARTATISFPRLPEFDISAKPLTRSTFNAMQLPGMKPYVQASISDVARAFVRPNSYTVDVDRLLLGREASMRTSTVGVLQIIIHSAEDLPKMDAMGTCDAYVAVSFSKYNKPIFSTRTIVDNPNPSWEEPAFCLVSTDEVEGGEYLRLRVSDSDRFSSDDVIGQVEVELAELIDTTSEAKAPVRRRDDIQPDRPGMRCQGTLTWSVRFVPLWQMPEKELNERMKAIKTGRPGECDEPMPQWMHWLAEMVGGEKPDWAKKREERNRQTLAWFTGAQERDALEAMAKPNEHLRSGVLQFHIHQLTDLEVESADGTYSAKSSARKSAAGGKPALSDLIDRTSAENPDPPSAYVEVHLNDRLIYRTRTKQLTPTPYFNAIGERFLRDWRMAKLVFVVRDERDREHDPILGIVTLRLEDVFSDRSQFTRWYPIIGGLGWGRIRLSLLWKPVDMDLPPRVSGFEVATLEIKSLVASDLSKFAEKKGISVSLETEADRYTISSDEGEVYSTANTPSRRSISISSLPATPATAQSHFSHDVAAGPSTSMSIVSDTEAEMEWDLTKPIKLAVEYRHSCSVLVSFITRHGVMRKKKVIGLASVRLNEVEDWVDNSRTVPIFGTASVKDAIQAYQNYQDVQEGRLSLVRFPEKDTDILGFVSLDFRLRPGVSRAHARLAKKDMRFKRVYEAWELEREVRLGLADLDAKSAWKADRPHLRHHHDGDEEEEEDEEARDGDGRGGSDSSGDEGQTNIRRTASGRTTASMRRELEQEDEDDLGMSERRAHSKALHKRNKGIFQLKIARTGKFVKDTIEAKLYARANDRRVRGQDVRVEHEGQSKI